MDPKAKSTDPATMTPIALPGERTIALDCELFLGPAGPLPMTDVQHIHFADLTADLLATVKPSRIILLLFAAGYDAVTVVEMLEDLGYVGKLTVLAPALPRPRLVERELRSLGPGTRLTLISP